MEAEGLRGAAKHASESAMTGVEAGLTGEGTRETETVGWGNDTSVWVNVRGG